jgi:hypothetical protein
MLLLPWQVVAISEKGTPRVGAVDGGEGEADSLVVSDSESASMFDRAVTLEPRGLQQKSSLEGR